MTDPSSDTAHSEQADSDVAGSEVADTCRPVELPDGSTIRVLGSGDMSPETVEALGAVVEAAKRRMESEPPNRKRIAIDAVTEALSDVSPSVPLLLRVRVANAVIRALDAADDAATVFRWGEGVSCDASRTDAEVSVPVCDDGGREVGEMRMGYANAAVLGAMLTDAAREDPVDVWLRAGHEALLAQIENDPYHRARKEEYLRKLANGELAEGEVAPLTTDLIVEIAARSSEVNDHVLDALKADVVALSKEVPDGTGIRPTMAPYAPGDADLFDPVANLRAAEAYIAHAYGNRAPDARSRAMALAAGQAVPPRSVDDCDSDTYDAMRARLAELEQRLAGGTWERQADEIGRLVAEVGELRATIARVREVAEDIGNWGWPNDQARQYSASLLAALDGDTPKETT